MAPLPAAQVAKIFQVSKSTYTSWRRRENCHPCSSGVSSGSTRRRSLHSSGRTRRSPRARGQDMDEQEIRPRHITATSDGYLSLPLANAYLWLSRRGLRGRHSQIVYYRPDGRQIIFKSGFGAYMERFRADAIDLDALVEKVPGPRRRNQARHGHGGVKSSDKKSMKKEKSR